MPRITHPLTLTICAVLLTGCAGGLPELDFDFRNNGISDGVTETAPRPEPDANGLITYPTYQVAVARLGDTVATVASRIGLSADELAAFNARGTTDVLREGEVLALPRQVGVTATGDITDIASAAIDNADPGGTTTVQPGAEPVRHVVARGETAFSVARLYNVPVRSLAEWNGLGPDLAVREGQILIIPLSVTPGAIASSPLADGGLPGDSTPPPPPSSSTPLPDPVETAALPESPDLTDTSEPEPVPTPEPEPQPAPEPEPEPQTAQSQLQRPVSGTILRGFSSANEGVDIAAAAGTPVLAAEAGEVAAITEDTDQIPILVIRHSGNMLTVYANIRNITVARGDSIARGQQVAEVGPGDPSFLHFEVRQGFEAIDPQPLIE